MGIKHVNGKPILDEASSTLLSGATATTTGTWKPVHGIFPLVVSVEGTFVATVQVRVSNKISIPADSDNARPQLGSDLDAPGQVLIDAPQRWVKVVVTAFTSGSVEAYAYAGG